MKFARSTGGAGKLQAGESAAQDEEQSRAFPALVEWLTARVWDDGAKRETGTIMVLAEDGVWKAWIHDRDGRRACWLSAGSLTDLVLRVEECLEGGAGEWRVDKRK